MEFFHCRTRMQHEGFLHSIYVDLLTQHHHRFANGVDLVQSAACRVLPTVSKLTKSNCVYYAVQDHYNLGFDEHLYEDPLQRTCCVPNLSLR